MTFPTPDLSAPPLARSFGMGAAWMLTALQESGGHIPPPALGVQAFHDLESDPRIDHSRLYFEAHITLTPLTPEDQSLLTDLLGADTLWRQASFSQETKEHRASAFITCRHRSLTEIKSAVRLRVSQLQLLGLEVTRWKIEDTLLDSRHGDEL